MMYKMGDSCRYDHGYFERGLKVSSEEMLISSGP